MNITQIEQAYANATFDYIDNEETNTYEEFNESIETTEDFLVNLDFNFYEQER